MTKKAKLMIKRICICTSASFYRQALEVEKELKDLGFKVAVPSTATVMRKTGDFNVSTYKNWYKDPKNYNRKAYLMKNHFNKIMKSDIVLIVNLKKNGLDGYIGGNTIMELAIAFLNKKPIYILNKVSKQSPNYEEILGVKPKFIDGDLTKIK